LHARAAARFVQLASRFQSQVKVSRGSQVMDGKSIMGILLLAAANGAVLTVSTDGGDEEAALDALCAFIDSGFGEDTCSA
jgi:phosphocarrier protein